jgi:hypothetical protein
MLQAKTLDNSWDLFERKVAKNYPNLPAVEAIKKAA